ncbi:hypothetical protein GGQ80_003676 [Sphingomonas jinjuensis]|uniref:Uncharacterized protein n=1 Tax=Sphingomonas jinjuensis TaxID=535907 RepID=A0A840FFR3_9SPHN|nr:hypothetical protein [Sphingomonas jinjuensis]
MLVMLVMLVTLLRLIVGGCIIGAMPPMATVALVRWLV